MKSGADSLRVVLDTNVLFSALAFPKDSPPDRIYRLARERAFAVFLSADILHELERALLEKAAWDLERVYRQRRILKTLASFVKSRRRVSVVKRKDADNRILECALAARAHVLVSGDKRDLLPLKEFRGIPILAPRSFLQLYFPDKNSFTDTGRVREKAVVPFRSRRKK